jgi:hypothetical protein
MVQVSMWHVGACDLDVVIENGRQSALFTTRLSDLGRPIVERGVHVYAINIDRPNLRSGSYFVSFAAVSMDRIVFFDVIHHVPFFQISGSVEQWFPLDNRWGDIYFPISWDRISGSNDTERNLSASNA